MTGSAVAAEVSVEKQGVEANEEAAHRWSLPAKVGFRFSFIYLMLFMFCNGNVTVFTLLQPFPTLLGWIDTALFMPLGALTQWWAVKAFHLTGLAAVWHEDGSGDTALHYSLCITFFVVALLGTLVWSALDRKRPHYQTLYAWLRFFLRLNIGMGMLQYGFYKVFPIQMQPPNMAVLNEPLGQTSPMTLLWTLLGLSPMYERICGIAEVMGGLLILFRRTALAGALLSAFVMTNVVLYNVFFDVPVKLYAVHVLLMAVFVMIPDLQPMWDFFVMRRSAKLLGVWVPPASRKGFRTATAVIEISFLLIAVISYLKYDGDRYAAYAASVRPSPVIGLWTLDDSSPAAKTIIGVPWRDISIDNLTRGMARSTDGQLWRMYLTYDEKAHTIGLISRGGEGYVKYAWATPDANHLVLTAMTGTPITLSFHRDPTPKEYPVLTRKFHLVSEFGYEH